MRSAKEEWLGNVKNDLVAGLVVCMALIPEVIGFTIVAGVDPMVGVYSSFCISVIISIFGGRTGMISAAAGSMAFVLASLVRTNGVEYMLWATILTGIFQIVLGICKIGKLARFIPQPVMIGFVNALGIMMFKAQIEHFEGPFILIVLACIGIAIIYLLPRLTKIIPSPIVSIIIVTIIVFIFKINIPTLGDLGKITTELPRFRIPNAPLNFNTFKIILPYSISLSIVGLVESILTAQLVDERTDTYSNKNREAVGQGLANITAGFFGGIAGCGMIGQTVVNQEYGGRGRLSTLSAGTYMLFFIIVLNKLVVRVPVVALAAVMVVVAITTFNWHSIKTLNKVPITDTIVMVLTVIIVLLTNNLAYGVVTGIILSSIFFMAKVSRIKVEKEEINSEIIYYVKGPLYFASTEFFEEAFDFYNKNKSVKIDFTKSEIWDQSAVIAIDKVMNKFKNHNVNATLTGLNSRSEKLFIKISTYKK